MIDVIYLAAGQGKRAGLGYPKQYARLGGKPIMVHGLEVLQQMPEIGRIIIVCQYDELNPKYVGDILPYVSPKKEPLLIQGGDTRQQSVANALKHVTTEHVLITEAVRPFITAELIRTVINTDGDFVTPWISPLSTALTRDGEYIDRDSVGQVQMPQKYKTKLLRHAHQLTYLENTTDDAALVIQATELKPLLVPGIEENIKITTPLDLVIAEAIYQGRLNRGE
jgi:2-C-methyl-D-erythritol 4-phosphate cytidylyltransferase